MALNREQSDLLNKAEDILDTLPDELFAATQRNEKAAFTELLQLLSTLDSNATGVAPTAANMRKVVQIRRKLQELLITDQYQAAVQRANEKMAQAADLFEQYYTVTFAGFDNPALYAELKKQAFELMNNSLLGQGIEQEVIDGITRVVQQNITGNGSFSQMIEEVRVVLTGADGKLGVMSRYAKQIATDGSQQFIAQYNQLISDDLGLEWYLYRGAKQDTSRQFCLDRYGKYWHKSEVQGWAKLDWPGRIAGTNTTSIFTYRGGYNCKHILVPVPENIVPEAARQRVTS